MCPSHLTTAQKLLLVNHARSVRLVWGTNCDQHLLNETLRSCYWATGGVPCIDSNARWAAKIITTFLEEPFLHVMRADYISGIKPTSCRAFLRPAQHWDAHGTRNSLMSVFKGSWYDADLSKTRGRAVCTRARRSAPGWQAAVWGVSDVSEWGQGGSWLCTALLQLGLGSSSW